MDQRRGEAEAVSYRPEKKWPRLAAPAGRDQFSPREEREADRRRAPEGPFMSAVPAPHQALVACHVRLPSENTLRLGGGVASALRGARPKAAPIDSPSRSELPCFALDREQSVNPPSARCGRQKRHGLTEGYIEELFGTLKSYSTHAS